MSLSSLSAAASSVRIIPRPSHPPAISLLTWCRLTGLAPLMLFTTMLPAVRNHRILAAWNGRQDDNARRAARGLPPKTRRRRRKSPAMAAAAPP
jgi:hypothetical protein